MEEVKAFNKAAGAYDTWFDTHSAWFSSELAALRMAVPKTGKGLEIGVGTGRFASELGIKTGVEPSENMAVIASERGIEVLSGYAEDLPVEDAAFDYTLMVTVDCFLKDLLKAFKEAWRITKPGGAIIIGMISKSSPLGKNYERKKKDNPFYRSARFHEVQQVKNLLEQAGFQNFSFWQTLLNPEAETLEEPVKGFEKGGFVVIKAEKKADKK